MDDAALCQTARRALQCWFAALGLALLAGSGLAHQPEAQAGARAIPVEVPGLHHVFQIDSQLFSGSSPHDEQGFAELVRLGVKVIVSVDGAKPPVELARQHRIRYVHLPIGYDAIPAARVAELIKAARTAEGPVYVHCHHGKHRGPAAVAMIGAGVKGWTPDQSAAWLVQAGTAAEYRGLYRDVRAFRPPDPAALARLPDILPEVAPTPLEVDAMVALDEVFAQLKAARAAQWREIPQHPDLTPAQAATLLREHFLELARLPGTGQRGADYARLLTDAETRAADLRASFQHEPADFARRDAMLSAVAENCAACHKRHRN